MTFGLVIWKSQAGTISWTNATGGNWSLSSNWSPNQVPASGDNVLIVSSGTYTVMLDTDATVASLTLGGSSGGQILTNGAKALTVANATTVNANGILVVGGGTFNGPNTVGGTFSWSGGEVNGVLSVSTGGTLNLAGTSPKLLHGSLTNAGTVNWSGGPIDLDNNGGPSGPVINDAGGLWNIQCDQAVAYLNSLSPNTFFQNAGTLLKSANTGSTVFLLPVFNAGLVTNAQGTLSFQGGGFIDGTYGAAAGTTIDFGPGNFTNGVAPVLSGPGTIQLNGGTLLLQKDIIPGLALVGGTVTLGQSFQGGSITNLTLLGSTLSGSNIVSGTFNWSAGTVSGLSVAKGGILNLTDLAAKLVLGPLTNAGTVNWSGGAIDLDNGDGPAGPIVNRAGGLWNIQCDSSLAYLSSPGPNTFFQNSGTMLKSANTGTTTFLLPLFNAGLVTNAQGTMSFEGGGFIDGTYAAAAGTTIDFGPGNFTNGVAPVLNGSGTYQFKGGSLVLQSDVIPGLSLVGGTLILAPGFQGGSITNLTLLGGTLNGPNAVSGTFNWSAGTVSDLSVLTSGILNLTGLEAKLVLGPLTNAGTVNWSGGAIDLDNGDGPSGPIVNRVGGLWNIQCDQSVGYLSSQNSNTFFQNAGTVLKSANAGTTVFLLPVFNAGMVTNAQGTISFEGGGTIDAAYGAAAGAIIDFDKGNFTNGIAPVLSGPGTIQFSGNNLLLEDDIVPGLVLVGGTVSLAPGFQGGSITNLTLVGSTLSGPNTVSGTFNWSAGTLNDALSVVSGGILNLTGPAVKYLQGTLTNAGTVNWSGGTFDLYNCAGPAGPLVNLAGGLWNIQCDQFLSYLCTSNASNFFQNDGTLRKSANTNTTTFQIPYTGTGSLEVFRGLLQLAGGGDLQFDDASYLHVEPGASLALERNLTGNTRRNLLFTPFSEVRFEGRGTALAPELLEAMSQDLGPTNTAFENNFAYSRLTLANNSYVKLVNLATNSAASRPEAVYASELVVPNGCTLDLNGLKLYSRVTQINGTLLGGNIVQMPLAQQQLNLGQTTPATITTSGELDEFVFFARANQTISVAVSTGAASVPTPLPPSLNYAQISLLDSTGAVLLSNSNSVAGGPAALLNVPLPADGTYRVQVRGGPQQSNATGNYEITVWIATPKVATLVLGQQANGLLETPFAVDQWNFSATAGQEVRFNLLNVSVPGSAFRLTGPSGFIGFSNLTASSDPVLLPVTGSYTLEAFGLGTAFNIDYGFILVPTAQTNLALGTTYTGQFAGSGQSDLFAITVTNPGPLLVTLANAGLSNVAELYVKLGSPPTRSSFDQQAATPNSASQQILLQHAAPGTYYVLVYGDVVATPGSFSLQATVTSLFLTSVTPNLGANNAPLVLTLTGAGFNASTEVQLVAGDGTPFAANSLTADSYSQMTAAFASNSLPAGTYSVRVSNPGGFAAELTNSVQVTPPGAAQLDTRLIMPLFLGRHAVATLYVEYANTGTVAMLAPLLKLEGTGPTPTVKPVLTLDASRVIQNFYSATLPPGVVNQVFILASGAQPGVLNPGERFQVPVYYLGLQQPWDFTQNSVELQVRVWTADDPTPIDWTARQETLRPPTLDPPIWGVIYTNLTANLTNSGAYVRMLDDNAQFLGRLGERVLDVDNLWNFEVQQAYGFAALPVLDSSVDASMPVPGVALNFTRQFSSDLRNRNSIGWFGRGWYTPWLATLSVQSNGGLVELIGQAGSARVFTLDARSGGYFSGSGDSSQLIALAGGLNQIYQLRDANGLVTQFRVDGKIDFVQDPNGNRVTAAYNSSGQLVTLSHTSGASLTLTYNAAGLIQMVTDSAGRSVTYSYDASNTFLQSATTDDGKVATYTYQTAGNLAQQNALTSVTRGGATRHFTYDSLGRLATAYFGTGQDLTTFGYSAGAVTTTDALGTSSLYFDYRGLIAKISDALGNTYTVEFNNDLHPTRLVTPTGDSQGFSFCTCGGLTSFQDELAHTYTFERNNPFAELTQFIDPLGNTTAYSYDATGNLLTTLYPDQTREQFGNYTPSGQPQQYINRRQQRVLYSYTAAGQVARQSFPDSSFAAFQYDARGNLLTVTNHPATGTDQVTFYTYNYTVDGDRLRQIVYPDGRWVAFGYDGFGRRQQVTDSTGQTNYLAYDAAGRLSQVSDASSNVVAQYSYNGAGSVQQVSKANGAFSTYSYDAAGNLVHLTNFASNATINSRFDYTYDSRGRRTSLATLDGTWTYEYDSISQLTHAVFASTNPTTPSQDLRYVYDAVGNRTTTILNGQTTGYLVNNLNQYTSVGGIACQYDADGNLISDGVHTNFYDPLGRLLQVAGPEGVAAYEYDALGTRTATVFNGQRTDYLLDPVGMPTVLAEQDGSAIVLAHYVQGSGLILRADAGGARGYYDFDAMGSTAGISGAGGTYFNQYSYLPFGDSMAARETVANPFQFIGQSGVSLEPGGLHFMRARYYSASLGRLLNPDPSRLASLLNLYRYAANEPTRFADPTGLQFSPGFKPNGFGRCGQPGVQMDAITFNPCPPSPPSPPSPGPGGGGGPGGPGGGGGGGTADSFDPNDLIGPSGFAQLNYLVDGGLFAYEILFQNETNATAPAQNVTITDPLSTNLNWTTFQLAELGFGDQFIPIAPNTQHFQTNVPASFNGIAFEVQIEAGIDLTSGHVFANFMSLDPFTGLPPAVDIGFLPPEDGTGRGTGHLSYSVRPKSGLATGVQIRNVASIRFDINPIITTDQIDPHDPSKGIDTNKQAIVTIDSTPPISAVSPLAAVQANSSFLVCWSGTDVGSGIASYDIYVSTNNGPFAAWILGGLATNTCATFIGQPSTKYGFYSVAHDGAGNVQAIPSGPNTQTTTPATSLTPQITSINIPNPGQFQVKFSGTSGLSYTVLTSVNLKNWTVAGTALETSPGQFQFLDPNASGLERYYRIRFP